MTVSASAQSPQAPMSPNPVAVGIVGNASVPAARLRAALEPFAVAVAFESDDAASVVGGDRKCDVAVVVWAGKEGFDPLRELAAQKPLVVVVPDSAGAQTRKLLRVGVAGIVVEQRLEAVLPGTVHAVSAGQVVVPAEGRRQLERAALSTREKQILAMVVMGLTNHEIGTQLYLTESTVKTHLSSAFAKLGVRSRYEAAALIMDPEQALGPGILHISDDVGSSPVAAEA